MKKFIKKAIKYNLIKSYINQLASISKKVSEQNNKNKVYIIADIIYCTFKYGSSPNNYLNFKFYELNPSKRNTYVTHRISEKLISKYNNDAYREIFEDKTQFAEAFKEYFGREWISLKGLDFDKFEKFISDKETVIFKPIDSAQGQGIEKIDIGDFESYRQIYNYLKDKHEDNGIIENWIIQHEEVSKIYSKSVNPVRVITVYEDGKCNILAAGLTLGNGRDISNASCNDMVSPIDFNTGILKFPAEDNEGNVYHKHPITDQVIEGVKIPYWEDIMKMLEKACQVIPEVAYVGWDIAITPGGVY